jgi:ankyrin repeat protein
MTELHLAAFNGHEAILREQLAASIPVDIWTKRYGTPLCAAAQNGQLEAMRLLLDAGAEVDARTDPDNFTPLFFCINIDCLDGMDLLLDRGADIHAKDTEQLPSLFRAIAWKKEAAARKLLERGSSVAFTNKNGGTILHTASIVNVPSLIRLLIEFGAEVNAVNNDDLTPLDIAMSFQKAEAIEELQKHGAVQGSELTAPKTIRASLDVFLDVDSSLVAEFTQANIRNLVSRSQAAQLLQETIEKGLNEGRKEGQAPVSVTEVDKVAFDSYNPSVSADSVFVQAVVFQVSNGKLILGRLFATIAGEQSSQENTNEPIDGAVLEE